jgi:predicted RNA-binding Zn-ribbon protein involved in translation (DUF1610 family)
MAKQELACQNCGANLKFLPGTTQLICEYCGTKNEIPLSQEETLKAVQEIDYKSFIASKMANEAMQEILTVKCTACGAEITFKPNITSDECPFCGTSIIVTNKVSKKILKPKSLLPFKITRKEAQAEFAKWLGTLWFAPNKLKKYARKEDGLNGIYLPYWTFDTRTTSSYTGQRGDDYYVTETYTTQENGKMVTRTRQVKHTRWSYASGNVRNDFDDVLVVASNSLPRNYANELEPWDLVNLVAYDDNFLSGFRSESYQLGLEEGFEIGKTIMYDDICITIRDDIGGDQQRIDSVNTSYSDITFKHILLPVWISAYRFKEKVFRFMVNARTGEVQGERPYSIIKITLAILAVIIVIVIVMYFNRERSY